MKLVAVGQNKTQGKPFKKSHIKNFIETHDNNDNSYDTVKTTCQN
jgi:hypothetical protein